MKVTITQIRKAVEAQGNTLTKAKFTLNGNAAYTITEADGSYATMPLAALKMRYLLGELHLG